MIFRRKFSRTFLQSQVKRSTEPGQDHSEVEIISSSNNISLIRLLHQCFGWQFYAVGILKFFADCTGFVGPLILNKLVGFIEDQDEPVACGSMYAALMFVNTLIGTNYLLP